MFLSEIMGQEVDANFSLGLSNVGELKAKVKEHVENRMTPLGRRGDKLREVCATTLLDNPGILDTVQNRA